MLTMIHASSGLNTCDRSGCGCQRMLPCAFSTRTIANGVERMPRVAKVVKAAIISIG